MKHLTLLLLTLLSLAFTPHTALATIDDALSFALEAANPYVKEGFTVREDYWGGDLPAKQTKAIVHQLFKGNEYWFWLGSDEDFGEISFDVFDTAGKKVSSEATSSDLAKGVRITPARTGTYVAVFTITLKPTPPGQKIEEPAKIWWALAYGWK